MKYFSFFFWAYDGVVWYNILLRYNKKNFYFLKEILWEAEALERIKYKKVITRFQNFWYNCKVRIICRRKSVLRKLKAFILFLNLIGIGASIYYKLYMFACFTVLLFFYFLYIFLKREEMETTNFFNKRALISSNIILFCFMLIFFRLIQVQIFDSAML